LKGVIGILSPNFSFCREIVQIQDNETLAKIQSCRKRIKKMLGFTGYGNGLNLIRTPERHPSGAKQAAEKGLNSVQAPEEHPQGLKAR
jgi:hypothetical protein